MRSLVGLLLLLLFVSLNFAQEENRMPAKDDDVNTLVSALSSTDNIVVETASQLLGDRKAIEGLNPLIEVAKNHANAQTRIVAITALSNYVNFGEPTTSLGNIVLNDSNDEVVYAALLAIANIQDVDNPILQNVVDFIQTDEIDDIFIKDISKRLDKYIER